MKKYLLIITFSFVQFAVSAQQSGNSYTSFYAAYTALKNMLEGKDSLNYEKAVFVTENAYYGNAYDYEDFKEILNFHTDVISLLADNAMQENKQRYDTLGIYAKKMFRLNALNWAIYKYITDTITFADEASIFLKLPFAYTTQDPYGSTNWENTQVLNLLLSDERKGNCYALASLFKIFSDRLQSDARLVTAPHHIYIQNRNPKGDFKNVELASGTFPGDGSIQTLTYTTHDLIMSGMAQRPLSNKDAIALNLIYLAKGFQHKFGALTHDFLLQCAELALEHDTLSLNALLLQAEVTEARLLKQNKTVARFKNNQQFQEYEKQLSRLYKAGYREIPEDIERIIISAMQGNSDRYIKQDKTPNPFKSIGLAQRYATLSDGLFEEFHPDVDTIRYFNALLNTRTNKIISWLSANNNHYKVDPVVFAMSVDPLAHKYPSMSPYAFGLNNPIFFVDLDGNIVFGYEELSQAGGNIKNGLSIVHSSQIYKSILSQYQDSKGKYYHVPIQYNTANSLNGAAARTTVQVMYEGAFRNITEVKDVSKIESYMIQVTVSKSGRDMPDAQHAAIALNDELTNHVQNFAKIIGNKELSNEQKYQLLTQETQEKHHDGLFDPSSDYNKVNNQILENMKQNSDYGQKVPASSTTQSAIQMIEERTVTAPNKSSYNKTIDAINKLADTNAKGRSSNEVNRGKRESNRVKFKK